MNADIFPSVRVIEGIIEMILRQGWKIKGNFLIEMGGMAFWVDNVEFIKT